MHLFRKLISVALAAAMLLCAALPALAAPGDATVFRDDYSGSSEISLSSMAYYNGHIYIFSYDNRYGLWNDAEGKLDLYELNNTLFTGSGDTESEDLDDGETRYTNFNGAISGDDGIYFLFATSKTIEEDGSYDSQFETMELYKAEVAEDGTLSLPEDAEPVEMEWDDMVDEYDNSSYPNGLSNPQIRGGKLVGSTYLDSGDRAIAVLDVEDGSCTLIDLQPDDECYLNSWCFYQDGSVLLNYGHYTNETSESVLHTLNLETEEEAPLCTVTGKSIYSMVYDEAKDTLYFACNGELCRMKGADASTIESISALAVNNGDGQPTFLTDDGRYLTGDYQTVVLRGTDPSQRAEISLTVYSSYNTYVQNAAYTFGNTHSNVEVVMVTSYEDVVQAMMNQSDAVDIYVLSVSDPGYAALLERGYLADLSSSDKITNFVNSVYPGLQDVLIRDGKVVALPVELYTSCMSYSPKAAEALGVTELPTSWLELFRFLAEDAPALLESHEGYNILPTYNTAEDMRNQLFTQMFQDYMLYLEKEDVEFAFDTDLMHSLLDAFEKIDFTKLGLMEDYDDDDSVSYSSDDDKTLFSTWGTVDCGVYNMTSTSTLPLMLSLGTEDSPRLRAEMSVAFVNPYSKNQEAAIEYLETTVDGMEQTFIIDLCPDQNEPVLNAYYEQNIQSMKEYKDSLEQQIAECTDEDEKAALQEQLESQQQYIDEYTKNNAYDASEESIAKYREYGDKLRAAEYFGVDIYSESDTDSMYSQITQYLQGAIDANTMLQKLDKTVKMMILEKQ